MGAGLPKRDWSRDGLWRDGAVLAGHQPAFPGRCLLQRAEELRAQHGAGEGRHKERGDAELVSASLVGFGTWQVVGRSQAPLCIREGLICISLW